MARWFYWTATPNNWPQSAPPVFAVDIIAVRWSFIYFRFFSSHFVPSCQQLFCSLSTPFCSMLLLMARNKVTDDSTKGETNGEGESVHSFLPNERRKKNIRRIFLFILEEVSRNFAAMLDADFGSTSQKPNSPSYNQNVAFREYFFYCKTFLSSLPRASFVCGRSRLVVCSEMSRTVSGPEWFGGGRSQHFSIFILQWIANGQNSAACLSDKRRSVSLCVERS